MQLIVLTSGVIRCLHFEDVDLRRLGELTIQRASHVEPASDGQWLANLSPVHGPQLGPFDTRSQALAAELRWLEQHWLSHSR
jgi:hypothetical protein